MARWFLVAFVLALLPVVAVITHPELRRVIRQDIGLLLDSRFELYALPDDSPERETILRLERIKDEQGVWQRVREYSRIARETRQPYLYAAAIRDAMQFQIMPRLQPLSLPSGPMEAPPPDPEREQKRRQMAQQVLSLSEQMSAIDGNNAFPYIAKTCALFALGKEEAALQSLQQAAACPKYVEYDLAWAQVLAPPSLTAEERTLLVASVLFPHLSRFHETMRYVVSLADRYERKGDHRRAIALREAVASIGARMRDAQGAVVPSAVGVSLQEIAWNRKQDTKMLQEEDVVRRITPLASAFATYARQHGRPDLAQKTLAEASRSEEFRQKMRSYVREGEILEVGWSAPQRRILSFRTAGVMLLLWSFAMAFLLGASLILFPLWRSAGAWEDHIAPVASALVVAGVFVAAAAGGALALDGFGTMWTEWLKDILSGERIPSSPLRSVDQTVLHGSACVVMSLLSAVCFVPPLVRLSRGTAFSWVAWSASLGILLALSVVSTGAVQGYEMSAHGIVLTMLTIAVVAGGMVGLIASPFYAFLLRRPLPVLLRAGVVVFWGLMSVVVWMGFLNGTALWLAAGLVLWLVWSKSLPEDTRTEAQRAVYRFGISALILAIFGLWLYAVLGFTSLPLRAEQHAHIDQLIRHGEMSLMEKAL